MAKNIRPIMDINTCIKFQEDLLVKIKRSGSIKLKNGDITTKGYLNSLWPVEDTIRYLKAGRKSQAQTNIFDVVLKNY